MQCLRTPRKLSAPVLQQLNLYTLAASAAGVSLLALAQPAEAKIIYTKADITISPYSMHSYGIDLTHDGKNNFVLKSKFYSTTDMSAGTQRMLASAAKGNGVIGDVDASALKRGTRIGGSGHFGGRVMASDWGSAGASTSIKRGPWIDVTNRYLGLEFKIKGKIHYGWARLTVQAQPGTFYLTATLTGYAYETVANRPIIAGRTKGPDAITLQPGGLGELAAGAAGLRSAAK